MTISGWFWYVLRTIRLPCHSGMVVLCGYRQKERHESKNSSCSLYRVCSRFAHHLALLEELGARAFVAGAQSGRHSK